MKEDIGKSNKYLIHKIFEELLQFNSKTSK